MLCQTNIKLQCITIYNLQDNFCNNKNVSGDKVTRFEEIMHNTSWKVLYQNDIQCTPFTMNDYFNRNAAQTIIDKTNKDLTVDQNKTELTYFLMRLQENV